MSTTDETQLPDVPDGVVKLVRNPDRYGKVWYLVSIGRPRYVKRFNLSAEEAAQLRDLLAEFFL